VWHRRRCIGPSVSYPKWMVLQLDTAEDRTTIKGSVPLSARRMAFPGGTYAGRDGRVERAAIGPIPGVLHGLRSRWEMGQAGFAVRSFIGTERRE